MPAFAGMTLFRDSLIDLRADGLHDLAVLEVLRADERREFLGRGNERLQPADLADLLANVRAGEQPVDLAVQLREHWCRHSGGGENSDPRRDFEAREDLAQGRKVREARRALLARDGEPAQLSRFDVSRDGIPAKHAWNLACEK